jgi:glycosyltransferase involved in cell wall biosynthesis
MNGENIFNIENKKISILIPTYKAVDSLDLCIRSCIEGCTDLKNIEIIIGVDGTYEICKHILEKWKNFIKILNLETNIGLCRITNLLVYNASYPLILIINDDNIAPLGYDVSLLESYQPNSVISPNQIEPFPSIFKQFKINNIGTDPKTFNLTEFWNLCNLIKKEDKDETGSTLPIFMSKIDYLRLGGWDENYPQGMVADCDFFFKCILSGLKMTRIYNCHFYHFASISVNGEKRILAEQEGHKYFKYKWGNYMKRNLINNNISLL